MIYSGAIVPKHIAFDERYGVNAVLALRPAAAVRPVLTPGNDTSEEGIVTLIE